MRRTMVVTMLGMILTACGGGGSTETAGSADETSGRETESVGAMSVEETALNAVPESERVATCEYLEGLRPPGETDCGEDRTIRTHSMDSCMNMLRAVAGESECTSVGADYVRCAEAMDAVDVCNTPMEERAAPLSSEACVPLQPCMRLAMRVGYDE